MPLKINELETKEDYIEVKSKSGIKKLIVTNKIPDEVTVEFGEWANVKDEGFKKENVDFFCGTIKKLLKSHESNNEKDVDRLFEKALLIDKIKIITFVSEFIAQTIKKKEESKTS